MIFETCSLAQKPPHKDLKAKWLKPSHLALRPLMLRFLTAPVHTLAETCSLAQLGYAKDSQGNWSKAQTSCLDCRFATPS
ncbi:hypothetical protein EFP50_02115 [Lacticaseibacillus paracasei]|nr:hypothetical protein [Lacticaseibacillus paracasei]